MTTDDPTVTTSAVAPRPALDLTTETYERMRGLIVSLKLAPGLSLNETELSARLNVSRTPIRAAIQRLAQEGFVTGHRVGTQMRLIVAPLTTADMYELFHIVGALESVAARWAASLPDERRQVLARQMQQLNDDLRAAAGARPPQVALAQDLHVRFHRSFVESAAGARLLAELNGLQGQVERYERVYTSALITDLDQSLQEHERMIGAIVAGDAEAAEQATLANWRRGADRHRQTLETFGERGIW